MIILTLFFILIADYSNYTKIYTEIYNVVFIKSKTLLNLIKEWLDAKYFQIKKTAFNSYLQP